MQSAARTEETPSIHRLFLRPVYTYHLRLRPCLSQISIVCMMTIRMGSEPILSVKQSVSIGTIINFDGDAHAHGNGNGLSKQAFIPGYRNQWVILKLGSRTSCKLIQRWRYSRDNSIRESISSGQITRNNSRAVRRANSPSPIWPICRPMFTRFRAILSQTCWNKSFALVPAYNKQISLHQNHSRHVENFIHKEFLSVSTCINGIQV